MYKVKQIETRLKELANNGTELRENFFDVVEILRSELTWIGAHSTFPKNMPQKTSGSMKMELGIFSFR